MFTKTSFVVLSAVLTLAGCAASADSEPTATQDHAIIGALTSPIGFENRHMIGTWEPIDSAHFAGQASSINFADDHGRLTYRMGDAACAASCQSDGTSHVTQNPLVWFFAGTYVELRAQGSQEETSLFVSRGLDGEITLVDLDSWSWHLGRYTNTWRRNPTLTVNDLWR